MRDYQKAFVVICLVIMIGVVAFTQHTQVSGYIYEETAMEDIVLSDIDLTSSESARTTGIYQSEIIEAPFAFNAVGSRWMADPTFMLSIRTRPGDGEWSDWFEIHNHGDMTRPEDEFVVGEMIFVPAADVTHDQLQFRASAVTFQIEQLQFTFIDSTGGPSTEDLVAQQEALNATRSNVVEDTNSYPKPFVISRDIWCTSSLCDCPAGSCNNSCVNGDPLQYRTVNHLIVHHTVSNNNSADWAAVMRAIWQYHALSLCWGDIGYNYLIDRNGTIYEGHRGGDDVVGTHAAGANPYSMAVSLIGTFTEPTHSLPGIRPPAAMQEALINILAWKADQRDIDVYDSTYHPSLGRGLPNLLGHRDVYGTTTCPGEQAHDLLPDIRDAVAQRLGFTPPHIYIDELSGNFSRSGGNWRTGPHSCGFDVNAWYTWSTSDPSQATYWGEWQLDVPAEGSYEISVYVPFCRTGEGETNSATYTIFHKNGSSNKTISQRDRLGLWTTLGEYELSPNSDHRLRLTDLAGDNGNAVWFDAVRIKYLGPAATNQSPSAEGWVNSRTVNFSWSVSNGGSVSGMQLRAATDSNFSNTIYAVDLPAGTTNHTHTFDQDFSQLYWQVLLNDPNVGTIYSGATSFRMDSTPPTSSVNSIEWTNDGSGYVLTWQGSDSGSGLASYTIEYRIIGEGTWYQLLTDTTETTTVVVPQNPGTGFEFRSRAKDFAGNVEPPRETADVSTNDVSSDLMLKSPINNQWISSAQINFEWEYVTGSFGSDMRLQIATDGNFTNIIVDEAVTGRAVSYSVSLSGRSGNHFWRVIPQVGQTGPVTIGQFRLDSNAPTSRAGKLLRLPNGRLYLSWNGQDDLSGIAHYNIYYRRIGESGWTQWLADTKSTMAEVPFNGQTYWFRSQAADVAGNLEPLTIEAHVNTNEIIELTHTVHLPLISTE